MKAGTHMFSAPAPGGSTPAETGWPATRTQIQRWLFWLALIGLFVPIPRLGLPLSPENALYIAFVALWATETNASMHRIPTAVRTLAILTVVFMLWQFLVKWLFVDVNLWAPTLLRRALLLIMACRTLRTLRDFHVAAACVVGGMAFSGMVGVLTVFDVGPVVSFFGRFVECAAQETERAERLADLAGKRMMGLRGSVFGFSYLTAPAFLLLCGFLARAWSRRATGRMAVCYALMAVVLLCMALNAERSSFLALAAGLFLLLWALRQKGLAALTLVPLGLGLVVLVGVNEFLLHHQENAQNNLVSRMDHQDAGEYAARMGLAAAGALTVIDHPLSGGTEADYQVKAGTLESVRSFHLRYGDLPASHNSYVNAGMRAGVAGWALLAAMLMASLRFLPRPRRAAVSPLARDPVALSLRAAFVACLVNAIFHNQGLVSGEPMTWAILALGAGAAALLVRNDGPRRPAQPQARRFAALWHMGRAPVGVR